jgi:tetratricopeptide (TPR) repeat protein
MKIVPIRLRRGSNEKKKAAYQRASRAIEQYLQENSRDADALCDLALAKAHLGQEEEVERLLRKALALAPENPQVERAAAIAFESAGDQDRALSLISAALQHGARAEDLGRDPDLDTLSNNPRFAATLSRQGKNDVQH